MKINEAEKVFKREKGRLIRISVSLREIDNELNWEVFLYEKRSSDRYFKCIICFSHPVYKEPIFQYGKNQELENALRYVSVQEIADTEMIVVNRIKDSINKIA